MPSQAIALTMPSVHSGRFLEASVSSMRSTNAPPRCLANAQLNSEERADPTWNIPVGEGANLTRTGAEEVSDGVVVTPLRLPCRKVECRTDNSQQQLTNGLIPNLYWGV